VEAVALGQPQRARVLAVRPDPQPSGVGVGLGTQIGALQQRLDEPGARTQPPVLGVDGELGDQLTRTGLVLGVQVRVTGQHAAGIADDEVLGPHVGLHRLDLVDDVAVGLEPQDHVLADRSDTVGLLGLGEQAHHLGRLAVVQSITPSQLHTHDPTHAHATKPPIFKIEGFAVDLAVTR
jgi:hypothetical protein